MENPDLHGAIGDSCGLPLWHGRPQAARRFGVSSHTLWRFIERGHLGRSLPGAVGNTVSDDPVVIAAAEWAVTASRRIQRRATSPRPLAETVEGRPAVPVRRASTDTCLLTTESSGCYAGSMASLRKRILDALARLSFIDAGELALTLGEPLATAHRALTALMKDGLAQRVSHGTAHLPSSHRHYLTGKGIAEAADALDYDAPSDFVRAYPVSRQWLALLIRRMDAVASVYRLAATLSPGVDGLETRVEFQRRGRFDAVITLHNGRSFGVVRQGLALRRRSLYGRLRAIAEYRLAHRPSAVLVLVPSPWEQRLTDEFCLNADLRD